MDNTFIELTLDEDQFTKHVGADGERCRIRSRNRGAKLKVTLQQSSTFNDDLSALHFLDLETNEGAVPVMVKDRRGTTVVSASEGWVMKPADITIGKEFNGREWTLDLGEVEVFHVGSATR